MLNDFGIRSAIRACMVVYEGSSTGSGRTTRILREMKEGDIFVTTTDRMARHIQGVARRLGKNIKVHTISPRSRTLNDIEYDLSGIMERRSKDRGIFLDHLLIYMMYELAADRVQEFLTAVTRHQVDELELTNPKLARPIRMDWDSEHWGFDESR